MREHKYKAWDKENKVMVDVTMILFETQEIDYVGNNGEPKSLEHFELLEYTGLHDNTKWEDLEGAEQTEWLHNSCKSPSNWKGKEIYEGDIIKAPYGFGNPIQEVKIPAFFWCVGECLLSDEAQVIGNKFENPELLK